MFFRQFGSIHLLFTVNTAVDRASGPPPESQHAHVRGSAPLFRFASGPGPAELVGTRVFFFDSEARRDAANGGGSNSRRQQANRVRWGGLRAPTFAYSEAARLTTRETSNAKKDT